MILFRPIVTEKSLLDQQRDKYHFFVDLKATKNQIKVQFEAFFGAKVMAVNTMVNKHKSHMDWKRRQTINKSDQKKVIVTVAKNSKIKLLEPDPKKTK